MHDEIQELEAAWSGLLWATGLAACRWPLAHPVGEEAGRALERAAAPLARVGRVLGQVAGHGTCCSGRFDRIAKDAAGHLEWGAGWRDVAAIAGASCVPPAHGWPEARASALVHATLLGSLKRLCVEVVRVRARSWELRVRDVERVPIGRLLAIGMALSRIVRPPMRSATGGDPVRRALRLAVDAPSVLARLERDTPSGLEKCVVEAHYWLGTGELGQPWMTEWTPSA
jgi:hypothetical protein